MYPSDPVDSPVSAPKTQGKTPFEEARELYERLWLDPIRHTMELAQEEYGQYLEEYEEQFGESAREEYEERYV